MMHSLHVKRLILAGLILVAASAAYAMAPQDAAQKAVGLAPARGQLVMQLAASVVNSPAFKPAKFTVGRTGIVLIDEKLAAIGATLIKPAFDMSINPAGKRAYGLDRIFEVRFPASLDPAGAAQTLDMASGCEFARELQVRKIDAVTPNDPLFPKQWALKNTGQANFYGEPDSMVGTPGCDIGAPAAWAIQKGSPQMIVAVLDTGVDRGHPEFTGRILPGYDFANGDNDPSDDGGHGTCCASIILAGGNNRVGVAGIAWNVKLLPVKVLGIYGGYDEWIAQGIVWAADHGAKILSMSIGSYSPAEIEDSAISYAYYAKGCAIFCSAGNDQTAQRHFPSGYQPCISVGALSPCNTLKTPTSCDGEDWWGSNYGPKLNFLAPGTRIQTADIRGPGGFDNGDYFSEMNGTSAACPHAAGVAALLWSQNPALTNDQVLKIMEGTCNKIPGACCDPNDPCEWSPTAGFGRINAYQALRSAYTIPQITPGLPPGDDGGDLYPTWQTLFTEDFETHTVPGTYWSAVDETPASGVDTWARQSRSAGGRVHGGTQAAYCAANSNIPGQRYDNNMDATMTLLVPIQAYDYWNSSGYDRLRISFWYWSNMIEDPYRSDHLTLQIACGDWCGTGDWISGNSYGWQYAEFVISAPHWYHPDFQFRFDFHSDYSEVAEGVYIDDIRVEGLPYGDDKKSMPAPNGLSQDQAKAQIPQNALQLNVQPNPFSPQTGLSFNLETAEEVSLEVFSADGRRIAVLQSGRMDAGAHLVNWSGVNDRGEAVPAGVYFARLSTPHRAATTARMIFLK